MLRQESPSEWRRDAIDVVVATLVVTITLIALIGG